MALTIPGVAVLAGGAVGSLADATLRALGTPGLPNALRRTQGSLEDRLDQLTSRLQESAIETQAPLDEMQHSIAQRSDALAEVQKRVEELREQEANVRDEIAQLEKVQPEPAQAINSMIGEALDNRDKRGARRDFLIFMLGIVASILTGLLIQIGYGIYIGDISLPGGPSPAEPSITGSSPWEWCSPLILRWVG